MYVERLATLKRAYKTAEKANKAYTDSKQKCNMLERQCTRLYKLNEDVNFVGLQVVQKETEWRDGILKFLEQEMIKDLAYVFPNDGYVVSLSSRVVRGKMHIDARVSSIFSGNMPGRIKGTQGRIFQQVVSFSALMGVMQLLGISTVYVDEAFSGSSKANVKKLNALLSNLESRGFNLVIIAQDTTMADGIKSNRLLLSRSMDNKTVVMQEVYDV